MKLDQFVFNAIRDEAIKLKALPQFAQRNAEIGRKMYLKSAFGAKSAGQMITRLISDAVKETKAFNKSANKAKGK